MSNNYNNNNNHNHKHNRNIPNNEVFESKKNDVVLDGENEEETEKVYSMKYFMKGNAKAIEEIKPTSVIVSKRFVDEDGNIIPFRIKPISSKRIEQIQEDCTTPIKRKGRLTGEEKIDYNRFGARIGIESTVYPNFRDADLLQDYGLVDPVDLAKEILSVGGEYAEWISQVQRINGFDEDFEELVKSAKNS